MATSPVRLPASNPAGNNQTSPLGSMPSARPQAVPFSSSGTGTQNPFFNGPPATAQSSGSTVPFGTPPAGDGTYNPASSYSSGQTDISKQLTDIYGKGVGGMLDYLLKNMSGSDSQIFQNWLKSMQPVEASERAQLGGTLGAEGISGNSSVSAIANSNLESQFNAQAAGVQSQLQQQSIQDTMNILMGLRGDAAKEVASSGWTVFGDVLKNVGELGVDALAAWKGGSPGVQLSGSSQGQMGSSESPMGMSNSTSFSDINPGPNSSAPGGSFGADWSGNAPGDNLDTSLFDSAPTDVSFEF